MEIRIALLLTGPGTQMPGITVHIMDGRPSGHIMGTAVATTGIGAGTAMVVTDTRDSEAATILGAAVMAMVIAEHTAVQGAGTYEFGIRIRIRCTRILGASRAFSGGSARSFSGNGFHGGGGAAASCVPV